MSEIINTSEIKDCRDCKGLGLVANKVKRCISSCDTCNGSGTYTEESCIIITQDSQGNKIAIDSDSLGK